MLPNIRTFEQPNVSEHSNIEHPNIRILANIRTFEHLDIGEHSNIEHFNVQKKLTWWPLVVDTNVSF